MAVVQEKELLWLVFGAVLERRLNLVKCWCTGSGWDEPMQSFIAAHTALASKLWPSGKTMLITHQCFEHSWTKLAQCQGFLFCALTPQRVNLGGIRRPPSQDNSLTDQRNFPPHRASFSPVKAERKYEVWQRIWYMPLRQLLHILRPWFPGRIWTSAHQWQVTNGFLFLLCLHGQPLLPLLKCHCLDARVVLCLSCPPCLTGKQGEWTFCVLATVKPSLQQLPNNKKSRDFGSMYP